MPLLRFALALGVVGAASAVALPAPATEPAALEPTAPETSHGPETPGGEVDALVAAMGRVGSAGSPSFSPDGRWIAFVTDLSGVPQLWRIPVEGGYPRRVSALDDQVLGAGWSPDGRWVAFTLAPGGGLDTQVWLTRPDGTEAHRALGAEGVGYRISGWTDDGAALLLSSNQRSPAASDPYLYRIADGELTRIAEAEGASFATDLSTDGRRAIVWRMAQRGDNDLFAIDLASGEETLLTPHEGPGSFDGGVLAPDGRSVYLSTNEGRDLLALARLRLDEAGRPGTTEILRQRADAELSDFALSDDAARAALVWNLAGRNELEIYDTERGTSRPVELPTEIVAGLAFSRDGSRLALVLSGAAAPADVWVLDLASGSLRQLTFSPHPGVDLGSLVRPELVRYPAHDGLELSGWLYRPPGVAGAAPYVLSFHGGPEGQERPRFRSDYQALLSRGIGVFAPNVRGSGGFGKRFVNLDNGALRFDGIRDIESTARYLVGAGIADGERLGIMGGSYGGYMVAAGLTWYPELFAAGANLYGVVNFETFFAHTEPYIAAISKVEYGDPDTEAEMLRALSPIHKVDRIVAPTLVLHGANDTNVPVVEAEQMVDSLERRGVPVRYVLFPDEGHGFRKTANRITATVEIVRWFERYLGAERTTEPAVEPSAR